MSDHEDFCATEWIQNPGLSSDDDAMSPVYATLHFYYDDPDSMRRFRECNQAADVKCAIRQFDQWLRDQVKHYDREDVETLQEVRDQLWRAFGEYGVNLDDD